GEGGVGAGAAGVHPDADQAVGGEHGAGAGRGGPFPAQLQPVGGAEQAGELPALEAEQGGGQGFAAGAGAAGPDARGQRQLQAGDGGARQVEGEGAGGAGVGGGGRPQGEDHVEAQLVGAGFVHPDGEALGRPGGGRLVRLVPDLLLGPGPGVGGLVLG